MKRLKRWGIPALILLCLLLGGCRRAEIAPADAPFSIYASFYPVYALAQPLLEGIEDVQLNCLVQPQDGCLRAYQLSDWDFALLSSADALLIGGRGLESFEALLYALGEDGPAVSAVLSDADLTDMGAVNTDEDKPSHWLDDHPHIYMDTDGALEMIRSIASSLTLLDSAHEKQYAENLLAAENQLVSLKNELEAVLTPVQGNKAIVMNEALVYAGAAYGLDIDLCYERESGEELLGSDLQNCLDALQQSTAKVILLERQSPQSLCSALEAAGYSVAKLDVLSTRRAEEGFEGYLNAQRYNAQAIRDAFKAIK